MAVLAPRVVPDIDGNPTFIDLTFKWIDAVGDTRSDVLRIDAKATNAQIEEAVVRILQPSYASLYQVRVASVYAGVKSKSNAGSGRGFDLDNIFVYHAKSADRRSQRSIIPSPRINYFEIGSEIPDADHDQLVAWMVAIDALLAGTFAGVSLRYTQRREIGKKKDL